MTFSEGWLLSPRHPQPQREKRLKQINRSSSSEGRLNYSVVSYCSAGKPRLGCLAYPSLLEISCISTLEINMATLFPLHTLLFLPLLNGNTRERLARDPQGPKSTFKEKPRLSLKSQAAYSRMGVWGTECHSCPEVTVPFLGDKRTSSTRVG